MRGPYKVRLNSGGEAPISFDIDADSLAYSGSVMIFYRGTRIAHVVGTGHLLDVRGEVEPEPIVAEAEALLVSEDIDPDPEATPGDYQEPEHPGLYL